MESILEWRLWVSEGVRGEGEGEGEDSRKKVVHTTDLLHCVFLSSETVNEKRVWNGRGGWGSL